LAGELESSSLTTSRSRGKASRSQLSPAQLRRHHEDCKRGLTWFLHSNMLGDRSQGARRGEGWLAEAMAQMCLRSLRLPELEFCENGEGHDIVEQRVDVW
jgi:hypothetical protein